LQLLTLAPPLLIPPLGFWFWFWQKVVASLQARFEELQVENRALASRSAATDNSRRSLGPSVVVSDADAGRLYSVIEALLASQQAMQDMHQSSQQAMQDRHQSSLQTLQESLIANQRSLQEALAASQTHNFALAVAAGCLGATLLAVVVVRGRV
jgi:hypothetical protein